MQTEPSEQQAVWPGCLKDTALSPDRGMLLCVLHVNTVLANALLVARHERDYSHGLIWQFMQD